MSSEYHVKLVDLGFLRLRRIYEFCLFWLHLSLDKRYILSSNEQNIHAITSMRFFLNTVSLIFLELNPLPNGKILDWSKFKAFEDDKINVAEMMISVSDWVENIVGKGEIFCFSHNVFKSLLFQGR